jgi:hypothetical protein
MKTNSILLIALSVLILSSCKKDSNDATPATPAVNKLCDGNGGSSWMPLDSTDSWTYHFTIGGIAQNSPTVVVTGHQTRGGKLYAVTHDDSNLFQFDDKYLREDASHNLYYFDTNDNTEYLEVPGSPTMNQSWAYGSGGHTRKVTSLTGAIATTGCNYTGLLEISDLSSSGVVQNKFYYKKGLGLVYSTSTSFIMTVLSLESVTLQ